MTARPIPYYGYCPSCGFALEGKNLRLDGLDPTCRRCWTGESPTMDSDHTKMDPAIVASDQVCDAAVAIDRGLDQYVHIPFEPVDALVGAIPPGDVGFIAAFSGLGKTTFVASAVHRWLDTGKRVYCLPLESKHDVFRAHLACKKLGYHAGKLLTGEYKASHPDFLRIRSEVLAEMDRQAKGEMATRLYVSPTRRMDAAALRKAAKHAAHLGADILLVDHIDHLTGEGRNLHADSTKIVDLTLDLTLDLGLVTIATSQLNNEGAKGGDRLAMYQCPQAHHLYMGGKKRQVAAWMLGLFRPLRLAGLDSAELADARSGRIEAWKVLEPDCMGVSLMKSRHFGERVSRRAYLGVENGAVVELDSATLALATHGIKSNTDLITANRAAEIKRADGSRSAA